MKVIAIVGPTGIGKTRLSIALAAYFDGEIINADSTQVYRGLSIATAKVTEQEKEGIPHHLFDICDIDKEYTVYDYQRDCRRVIEEVSSRGHVPILVGGTGLYMKAALYDYQFEQEEVVCHYEGISTEELYRRLIAVDPDTAIHPHNRKRIERALCYYQIHQVPMSTKEKDDRLLFDVIWVGLTTTREKLYQRINDRVDQMVEAGLLKEARGVYRLPFRNKAILTPIGYKELFPYFSQERSLEECLDDIRIHSRHYAKRQDTWNRHQFPVHWFSVDFEDFEKTVREVISYIDFSIRKIDS